MKNILTYRFIVNNARKATHNNHQQRVWAAIYAEAEAEFNG